MNEKRQKIQNGTSSFQNLPLRPAQQRGGMLLWAALVFHPRREEWPQVLAWEHAAIIAARWTGRRIPLKQKLWFLHGHAVLY